MFSQVGRTVIRGFLCGLRLLTHHHYPAPEVRLEPQEVHQELQRVEPAVQKIKPDWKVLSQETPEVEQESLLCQLPQDILYLITENLYTQEERSLPESKKKYSLGHQYQDNLCLTCKELDRRITSPAKKIVIAPHGKRSDDSCQVFLSNVLHLVVRMAKKEGFNSISLDLSYNRLSDDMEALQWFIERCGQPPIVSKLQELDLFHNELESLPPAITELQQLQKLDLTINKLTDSVMPQIVKLSLLRELNLGGNKFQTLNPKISSLQDLKLLSLAGNNLDKDCLEILTRLAKLERLCLAANRMTLADIRRSFASWPTELLIPADDLKPGDGDEKLLQEFRKTSRARITRIEVVLKF